MLILINWTALDRVPLYFVCQRECGLLSTAKWLTLHLAGLIAFRCIDSK
jgi:hypothetical protein